MSTALQRKVAHPRILGLGLVLTVPLILAGLTQLPVHMNRPVTAIPLPSDADRMLLFFGYVDCPQICPTTMAALRRAHDVYTLHEATPRLTVTFVNLTEAADGVADRYAKHFDPSFHGVQSTEQDRAALMRELGVRFERKKDDPAGWHTDSVYVLAREGDTWNVRTVIRERPLDPDRIAELVEDLHP